MLLRRLVFALGLASMALALFGGPLPSARAAPAAMLAAAPAATAFGPPREVGKVTLAETSIDGPALWSGYRSGPQGTQWNVLAWTGTDATHRLTVMTSTDGIHYSDKRTLNETSFTHPAVTAVAVGGNNKVVLAWTGNDAHHSLNILYDVYGASPQKLTLWNENSFAAPGLQVLEESPRSQTPGKVYLVLAWAGTDANHSLNTLRFDLAAGLARADKVTLPAQYNSEVGPELGTDPTGAQLTSEAAPLFMTWAYRTPVNRMDALVSFDGLHWYTVTEAFHIAFPNDPTVHPPVPREWSAATPSIQAFVLRQSSGAGAPLTVWAWTGIDAAHSVNVLADVLSINGSPQKATLTETALGGPAVGGNILYGSNDEFVVAWTGTDAQHHLNIARIAV